LGEDRGGKPGIDHHSASKIALEPTYWHRPDWAWPFDEGRGINYGVTAEETGEPEIGSPRLGMTNRPGDEIDDAFAVNGMNSHDETRLAQLFVDPESPAGIVDGDAPQADWASAIDNGTVIATLILQYSLKPTAGLSRVEQVDSRAESQSPVTHRHLNEWVGAYH
jgi:hypothetical protein